MATFLNVHVRVFHKGKIVSKDSFDKNPRLWSLYPTHVEFIKVYLETMSNTKNNMFSYIDIDEKGINVKLNNHLIGSSPEK